MLGVAKSRKDIVERSFGQNPLEGYYYYNATKRMKDVRVLHDGMRDNEDDSWEIDDITWDDLEMDSVFLRVNHTNSFVGEQTLYHKLHILDKGRNEAAFNALEERIAFLDEHPRERRELELKLGNIGKHEDGYYLTDFMINTELWKIGKTYIYHILQFILVALVVCAVIFHNIPTIVGAVIAAIVNLTVYFILKQKYDMYLGSLADFKRIYDFSKWMEKHHKGSEVFVPEAVKQSLKSLSIMSKFIVGLNNRRQSSLTGDVFGMLVDYLWGILLIDVSVFNYIMKVIQHKLDDVFLLIDYVGELDYSVSVLSYRKSIDKWCVPEFIDQGIAAENIMHPLLKNPVGNDFSLAERAVITGANASGKSTFMKSVAINSILAQTINTCIADSMKLQPMHIITCMALRDDILSGESYYFREAKYLKRMLDVIDKNASVMIIIDEILKGTNTKERVAASKAIMKYIGERKCIAMVATHDNELTEDDKYDKFYFTSKVTENDIAFDYVLHVGACNDSNAITLLSFLGYPTVIVEEAQRNVELE